MRSRRSNRWWFLALVAFLFSCSGELDVPAGDSSVTLALQSDGLKIVDHRSADGDEVVADAHSHLEGATVEYVFHPADGSPAVFGEVADPRLLLSEFDENGEPDPIEVVSGSGLFEVKVPSVRGELEIWAQDGQLVGKVDFDPKAARVAQSALMNQSDILSPATGIVNHGSRGDKIDILFVSEGYTEGDMSRFHSHVREIANGLQRKPGYREIWSGINIWRQDIRSRSRGTGANARPIDTAFETASGISGVDRCIFFSNTRGQRAARQLRDSLGAEVVIVLVNREQDGACAQDGYIVTARTSRVVDIVAHELGHALFDLADEYETPRPGGYCSTGPNVSSSARSLPWSDMVNTSRLPTPDSASRGTIGAFEGAGYCSRGRYRPTHSCMMRSMNDGFCPVCLREVRRKMARYVDSGGTNTDTNTGTNTGSTNTGSTNTGSSSSSNLATPTGLSPDGGTVTGTEVRMTWSRVSGASNYQLIIERRQNGSYRQVAESNPSGRAVTLRFQSDSGDYRWKVQACNSTGCSGTAWATFTHAQQASSGTNTGSTNTGSTNTGSASSGAPSVPTGLKPTKSSVISDETPSMSWSSVSGATTYGFKMMEHDGNAWRQYVSEQQFESTRVRTTLRTNERWYAFAVQACNSSGCSAWTEYSTMYLRK